MAIQFDKSSLCLNESALGPALRLHRIDWADTIVIQVFHVHTGNFDGFVMQWIKCCLVFISFIAVLFGTSISQSVHLELENLYNPWSAKPDICRFRGVGSLYCFPRSPKIDFNNTDQAA